MISAGEDKKVQQLDRTAEIMCGYNYKDTAEQVDIELNEQCKSKVTGVLYNLYNDPEPMTPVQEFGFIQSLKTGRGSAGLECKIFVKNDLAGLSEDGETYNLETYINCMSAFVVDDKAVLHDKSGDQEIRYPFITEYLPMLAAKAREATLSKNYIPLPANLQKFIDDNQGVADGFFSRMAEVLFRAAIAHVPVENRLEAAKAGGVASEGEENVMDKVQDAIDLYKAAEDQKNKEQMQEAKDGLRRTFVNKVGEGPDFPVTFGHLPTDVIEKIFGKGADVPDTVVMALRKLYAEAVNKFYAPDKNGNPKGDPSKEESVKKPFITEITKTHKITDPSNALGKLLKLRVKDVEVKGGAAKKVEIVPKKKASAPNKLVELAKTGPQKEALQMLWNDIAKLVDPKKGEIPDDLAEAIVEDLYVKGVPDQGALAIAALYPTKVDKDSGEVTLKKAPKMVFNSWQKIFTEEEGEDIIDAKEQSVPDNTIGKTAVGAQHALVRIYADAMMDKKNNWERDEAAMALNRWVKEVEDEENDYHKTTDRIVSGEYVGKDGINMLIEDDSDTLSTIQAGNGLPLGNGWSLHPGVLASVMGVFGEGGATSAYLLVGQMKAKKVFGNTELSFGATMASYGSPTIVGEGGMLDDGSFSHVAFNNQMYTGKGEAFKMAEIYAQLQHALDLGSTDLVIGGKGGLISTGPTDHMTKAMPLMSMHYFPYLEGQSSSALGAKVFLGPKGPTKHGLFSDHPAGSLIAHVGVHDGMTTWGTGGWDQGNGIAMNTGLDGMFTIPTDKLDAQFYGSFDFGKSWSLDGEDSLADKENHYFMGSAALAIQPHEHFKGLLAFRGGRYYTDDVNKPPHMNNIGVAAELSFPFEVGIVTLSPSLSYLVDFNFGEKQIAGDNPTDAGPTDGTGVGVDTVQNDEDGGRPDLSDTVNVGESKQSVLLMFEVLFPYGISMGVGGGPIFIKPSSQEYNGEKVESHGMQTGGQVMVEIKAPFGG